MTSVICMLAVGLPFSAHSSLARVAPVPVLSATSRAPMEAASEIAVPLLLAVVTGEAAAVPDPPIDDTPPPAPPSPCAEALTWVAGAGLPLPGNVDYQCPSTQFAHQGAACWNGPVCPQRGLVAINMDRLIGTSTDYLRHVVAHEVCHIVEFQAAGRSSEASADACAAAHGASA